MRNIGIIRQANDAVRAACQSGSGLHFIDLAPDFLDVAGRPRRELFGPDRIHLTQEAYALWARAAARGLGRGKALEQSASSGCRERYLDERAGAQLKRRMSALRRSGISPRPL